MIRAKVHLQSMYTVHMHHAKINMMYYKGWAQRRRQSVENGIGELPDSVATINAF